MRRISLLSSRLIGFLMLLAAALLLSGCGGAAEPEPEVPYVVLVSLDGFRHDYAELHGAPNLDRIAQQGVHAEGLIPPFPSSTFPSHYSMATGLFPEDHGIVGNRFYDPDRGENFIMGDPLARDSRWWGGMPIWALAEQQGVPSATYFWPGSDVPIQNTRPSHYLDYDESVPNSERVQEVLAWLALPEEERPHLVMLYFSLVDDAGHEFGPEAPETKAAVAEADTLIGTLMDGIAQTELPVNLIVVSDHGMTAIRQSVSLGSTSDFEGFQIMPASGAEVMLYTSDPAAMVTTLDRLEGRDPRYQAYLRESTPGYLHYRYSSRIGDVVVIADPPAYLRVDQPGAAPAALPAGGHGFDPQRFPEMHGIFYAEGPNFKQGLTVYPFDNVNIYPLIAEILGLEIPRRQDGTFAIDGSLDVVGGILREPPPAAQP